MASTPPRSANLGLLLGHPPLLVALGVQAERDFSEDPSTCFLKLRQFSEVLPQRVEASVGVYASPEQSQLDLHRQEGLRG